MGDIDDDTNVRPGRQYPGTSRWVKVFGIIALVLVLVVAIVLVASEVFGVGGDHGPACHGPSGDVGGLTPPTSVGGPVDAEEAARTVEIRALDTMTFEPNSVTVSAGEAITFVVTNAGEAVHEFTLGDAAMQQEHADKMAHMPDGMAHDEPNSITLPPGETKRLTWRFGVTGTLEYSCHVPGHEQAGMRGRITVN